MRGASLRSAASMLARRLVFIDAVGAALLRLEYVRLQRLAEGQVDAAAAGQRVIAVGERLDAMIGEPRRPAPHHHVAALEPIPGRPVVAPRAAEQEGCR